MLEQGASVILFNSLGLHPRERCRDSRVGLLCTGILVKSLTRTVIDVDRFINFFQTKINDILLKLSKINDI